MVNFRTSFYRFCDKELQDLLLESGLTGVFLGVEALNDDDLVLYNKHTNVKDNIESIQFFRKLGVGIDLGFININPYSSFHSLKENEKNLYRTGFLSSMNFPKRFRAYRGMPLYKKLESDGMLYPDSYLNYYNYKYVDDDVERLASYLNEMFVGKYAHVTGDMFYFKMYHDQLIFHLKRIYRMNKTALDAIDAFNIVRETVLSECNEFCHQWYSELLKIGENGWDKEAADKIIADQDVQSRLLDFSNKIKYEFMKLSKKLVKIDKKALIHLA